MPSTRNYPEFLMLVRHGQSAGNVARDFAEANNLADINLEFRDVDVPLSELGENQAKAFGEWLAQQDEHSKPEVILASPYVRAQQTAVIIARAAGLHDIELEHDERLREREFGAIDYLTHRGIVEKFPKEAEAYTRLGKFYYRPPGGESWADVILRLRSVFETLQQEYSGKRVMIVCHSVVILCFRYLLEKMSETDILKIDRETALANASLTSYRFHPTRLEHFNFVAAIHEAGEKVTTAPYAHPNHRT